MKNPFAKDGRQFGDRRDGKLIRDLDSLHYITGIIYPNRCDNEAFISETIDLTAINEYLKKKNYEGIEYKYNLFQIINAGIIKMLTLRPKMNRFIVNDNFYQRNEVSTAFVVKKLFADNGAEALAFVHATDDDTIDTIHQKIYEQVSFCRSDKVDSSTDAMDVLNKVPRFISKTAVHAMMWLDRHGWVPSGLIETDPYYSSCVISNLGSVKMKSGYHHLTNWGSCSMITLIGEIKDRPFVDENGQYEMRSSVDIGITIDERMADGYYYAKSIHLFRKLMEQPELLERPMSEPVEF
ncbi:MAG: 2-oxo acid dehydrogenase subunit E2 [Mogibacterium sp.]|nr:2-oxo acid dehydrogenase subunit E2 [Mogibacterium sp.]